MDQKLEEGKQKMEKKQEEKSKDFEPEEKPEISEVNIPINDTKLESSPTPTPNL